jgi:O-antigen/teichoic acid export membrane protein
VRQPATPTNRLRQNTVVLAISNIGTALLSFVLAALIARALGEQGLGAYAVALAWVLPLALLAEFGIGTYLTREMAGNDKAVGDEVRSRECRVQSAECKVQSAKCRVQSRDRMHPAQSTECKVQSTKEPRTQNYELRTENYELRTHHSSLVTRHSLLPTVFLARVLMGGGGMLLLMLAAPLLTDDPLIAVGIQLSAPLVLIQPLYSTYTAVFRARGDMRPIPWLNIGMLLAQVVLTWGVFALTPRLPLPHGEGAMLYEASLQQGAGVLAALAINTLTSAGQLAACWIIFRRIYGKMFTAEEQRRRKYSLLPLLRASWHFGLAALFAALQARLGTILLEQLAGVGAAGSYAGANRFLEAAKLLPNAYFGALFPALAALAADAAGMRRAFRRGALLLGGYGVLAAGGLALLAPLLIEVAYGAAFAASAPVLALLGVSLVLTLLRGVRTLYWYAQGREGFVNAVNGAAIVLQVGLSVWLIPAYGAAGAALVLVGVEAWALGALIRFPYAASPSV